MKKCVFILSALLVFTAAFAQTNASKLPGLDKSPLDITYFPSNFPVLKIQGKATGPLVARAIYSRPQKNNRTIFGDLVEYNKVWRLGANEATEIEFFRDVKLGGKKVLKGKYTLYALVNPDEWTLILNKETDTWGAFKYDEKKDVARVTVPVKKIAPAVDLFTMTFNKSAAGMDLLIAWDDVEVSLPIDLR